MTKTIVDILEEYDINGHEKSGGTDKNTSHSYVELYESILNPYKEEKGSLLEIGVQYGGSIIIWNEYLKNFNIYGVDIEDQLHDNVRRYVDINSKKINLTYRNAYDNSTIDYFKSLCPYGFDVIIDDGPHSESSQVDCINLYLSLLKENGILIIEDVQSIDSIELFKKIIPNSDIFDYEIQVFDLRENKGRWDDIVFTIRKKLKRTDDKIAVFYHVWQNGNWKRLFHEQINSLMISGLYHAADFIHIGVNGDEELPLSLPKFTVSYNENKILEADTLKSLYEFSLQNIDYKVLYFHTKTISHEGNYFFLNATKWRYYLEYFTIHKWKKCVLALKDNDTCGVEYHELSKFISEDTDDDYSINYNPHYSGNFWWANTDYIRKLDIDYLYDPYYTNTCYLTNKSEIEELGEEYLRWRSEFWIGTGNPKKHVFYNTGLSCLYTDWENINPYDYIENEENVMNDFKKVDLNKEIIVFEDEEMIPEVFEELPRKKAKIVMISMFKNEAKTIGRMLESCYKYIDYWILQDNGSTDGTPEVVSEFFKDKNIPGFVYQVEEGWVGFGWNRDHLLQTCLSTDHGCDWIMKMDCDEYLEVDDDFDWTYFDNKEIQSFHVTAINPGCIYYRAWIWNASLKWKFQHDPAHETIYLDNEIGENFQRFNLPKSFRMVGTPDGESYSIRTKYISDALKLEEKMIREETMLTDTYHFWYIGKSYQDCYRADFYPLGTEHSNEFAKRALFYYKEYLKHINAHGIHEMAYFTMFAIGDIYTSLGDYENAIDYYINAEKYCPVRNEHIVCLARVYQHLGQYDKMLEQTTRLMDPNRKLPFPDYYFLLDTNIYQDSGPVPKQMHDLALSLASSNQENKINNFKVHAETKPRMWIVDNFYDDPHSIREFALNQEYNEDLNYYKGNRSKQQFIVPGTKEAFEKIIGRKITRWTETHGMCGRFQYCTAKDDLVYHCDGQTLAGMIYLTPNAPFSCGTSLFAHKNSRLRNENDFGNVNVFEGGFYDKTKFELVDTAGNVFNRLVLFDAKCIHSANEYFGTDITNSRLFHLFFFD